MNWVSGAAIAASLATMAGAQSDLRLTAQRAEGARRLCVYGSGAEAKVRRIGLGEPCPYRYRAPEPQRQLVPSMALRIGQERAAGRTVCIYRYAGRVYRAARPAAMSCPLTPGSSMQVMGQSAPDARARQ